MFIMIKIAWKQNKMFICCELALKLHFIGTIFGFIVKKESLYKKTWKQLWLLTKTDVNKVNNIVYLQKPMSTCTLTSVIYK